MRNTGFYTAFLNSSNPFRDSAKSQFHYYPFGSPVQTRSWSSGAYRFGFNGKEMDDENVTQDYGMRIYNPKLGRFLSVDPLTNRYPELTPYQFASNRPIDGIDLDGLEFSRKVTYDIGTGVFSVELHVKLAVKVEGQCLTAHGQNGEAYELIKASEKQFANSTNKYDERRKIQYSGSLEMRLLKEGETAPFNLTILDSEPFSYGDNNTLGLDGIPVNTQSTNLVLFPMLWENNVSYAVSMEENAATVLHELGHTGNINELWQDSNAPDVQLNKIRRRTYETTTFSTAKQCVENVMLYPNSTVNNLKSPTDPSKRSEYSPDQLKTMTDQTGKDQSKKPVKK